MQPEESPREPHEQPPPPPGPEPEPPPGDEPLGEEEAFERIRGASREPVEWPEEDLPGPDFRREIQLSQRQMMGVAGGLLLIVGVFVPIVSVPVVGGINVLTANLVVGGLLILIGAYSAVRAAKNDFRFLTWNAYGSLVVIGLLAVMMFANAVAPPEEVEGAGMGEAMMQVTTFQWGWVVLLFGAFLLIAAGHVRDEFQVRRAN